MRTNPTPVMVAALLMAVVTCSLADDAKPDADLLLKDSFESGEQAPDGWKQGAQIPGVKYVYDLREASEGKRSLSLQKSANRFFPIAAWTRTVEHTGNKPAVQVTAQVKADRAMKAILDVAFLDEAGEWVSHKWMEYIGAKEPGDPPATHDWKKYTGAADIPAGTKKLVIALQIYGPGKVWFDEVEVRYVDSADEVKSSLSDRRSSGTSRTADSRPVDVPAAVNVSIGKERTGRYLLVPPGSDVAVPQAGWPLLIVLPGGSGTADFHPFVRRIQESALEGEYVVAQPLAPPHVVWPTRMSLSRLTYTTEELIDAVIDDVAKSHPVDRDHIFLLAWSSGGPAAYAALLADDSPVTGALIAMSVFKPDQLPSLENARGRSVYLLHSPDDQVCPYEMARQADEQLQAAGVRTTLVDYDGGHGWHGPVFEQIRTGIDWLKAE